ncbi:hypothetical protein GCM10008967_38900 [Bacillus carboniphilus]|uniref:Small, acid-soluble spore protein, SspJ family n=1 Tax=Bacillus carboniphilus TaxID=86663 RepID=A0ABP3GIE4_9BACI
MADFQKNQGKNQERMKESALKEAEQALQGDPLKEAVEKKKK